MADSGKCSHSRNVTWSSISHHLAVQMRVLLRMMGRRAGWATIAEHGGLGKNPIHRLYMHPVDSQKIKILRVAAIEKLEGLHPVWDIRTDDNKVYLPEFDVTVSNCDDQTVATCSLARALGFSQCFARVISTTGEQWEHVFPIVGCGKDNPGIFIPLDMTVPDKPPGWHVPNVAAYRDFPMFDTE
jgi:hypothetical protein